MNAARHPRLFFALGAALLVAAPATAAESRRNNSNARSAAKSAPAATGAATRSFDTFQLVVERNIFNPNRVGRTRSTAEEKPPRVDEISLVGTVQHDQENLALFDSPDTAFRKAVREGETVGDFTVQRIAAGGVELMRGDQPVSLKVAQQLRRVEGGDWTVATNQTARADPRALAANETAATRPVEPTTSAELPADASEVLKRLMKKREKQLK